jgi:acyl carrier protein
MQAKVEAKPVPVQAPKPVVKSVVENGRSPEPAPAPKPVSKVTKTMSQSSAFQARIEKSLEMLHEHQAETARVHETYLKGQETYAKSVVQLMQQYQNSGQFTVDSVQSSVVSEPVPVVAPAPKPVAVPSQPKVEPVAVKPTPTPVAPAPVVAEPVVAAPVVVETPALSVAEVAVSAPANANVAELAEAMLIIVSEKTGYPVEMLEMSMDMESDLGIDSIKRVEILGAMQEQHPELPEVNPAELAELRTLQQIVDHLQPAVGQAPAVPVVAEPGTAVPAPQADSANVEELANAMLVIVSEKTGYPVEMLEMSMDMESDLGIDSIKRVEILGAMQEQHPDLPEVNPAELAELRTLQQIVDHLSGSLTGEPEKKLVRL